ncbi:ferritin-like domain-containing protein [Flavicella sediminum]|uniref:ferritin-like domain-containing protein n=1 Tax=Flavicella sediminum TaxID=2585141 RepID=UPI0011228205|nr:ferritin-like protein [Flavicella sediminum]
MILLKSIQIDSLAGLRNAVQTAIVLEHATIPPYLTAMFSLANTENTKIAGLIHSVVIEEMLHLTIACNLLNAIGGKPVLNKPNFVPTYPGPLPGGVENGLIVPIAKFSKNLVKNVFMVIEEPEAPIDIKLGKSANAFADLTSKLKARIEELQGKENLTIGEYYEYLTLLLELFEITAQLKGETVFTGAIENQVVDNNWFPANELFAITDLDSAKKAIAIIVDQGEGTSTDPFIESEDEGAGEHEPAHYYRFEEIYKGKELVIDPSAEVGYSYSGAVIPFFPEQVPNMKENPKMSDYPPNSLAYLNSKLFNYNYTNLLNSLHETFNGAPAKLSNAMGSMYALRLYALKLMALPAPMSPGFVAGPSYEYVSKGDLTEKEVSTLEANKVKR